MFGIFKRSKIENWEIGLLVNTITKLPKEYTMLLDQINDGLFRNVLLDASDIPGYVSFGLNNSVYKKHVKYNEVSYKITGIKVFNNYTSNFIDYEIYVSDGIINGYSIQKEKKLSIDINKIDISKFSKSFYEHDEYNEIESLLNLNEKNKLLLSEIYEVELEGKIYFHLFDLEDGDFIGMDKQKNIYMITHDPYEIKKLEISLEETIQKYRKET